MIGYWPFCNNSNDQSVNNNNGTVNGANITEDRFGNSSSAYSFDGTDDYINMNNPILTGENSITYSFWAYTESNEAMDVMGQFCLDDTTDCDNLKNIRIALNGSQTDGVVGMKVYHSKVRHTMQQPHFLLFLIILRSVSILQT